MIAALSIPFLRSLVDTDEKRNAAIAAITYIIIVILLLFINTFSIPDPPIEEEVTEIGLEGDFKGGSSSSSSNTNNSNESVSTPPAQEIETQDDESVYTPSNEGVTDTQEDVQQTTNDSQQEERQPDNQWNFGNFGNGNGEGQGNGSGDKFGDGDGEGGQGKKNGSGDGGYNPNREQLVGACTEGLNSQIEGTIALDIWVDENGKVVRTQYNENKSNTGNQHLIQLAEKATRCMKYEEMPGTGTQKVGTVRIGFKKQ